MRWHVISCFKSCISRKHGWLGNVGIWHLTASIQKQCCDLSPLSCYSNILIGRFFIMKEAADVWNECIQEYGAQRMKATQEHCGSAAVQEMRSPQRVDWLEYYYIRVGARTSMSAHGWRIKSLASIHKHTSYTYMADHAYNVPSREH